MPGYRWADDPAAIKEMQRKVPHSVGACFDPIEREMFEGPWVMGEIYIICDPYLFTLAQFLEGDGLDPARFRKSLEFRSRMAECPTGRRPPADQLGQVAWEVRLRAPIVHVCRRDLLRSRSNIHAHSRRDPTIPCDRDEILRWTTATAWRRSPCRNSCCRNCRL